MRKKNERKNYLSFFTKKLNKRKQNKKKQLGLNILNSSAFQDGALGSCSKMALQ